MTRRIRSMIIAAMGAALRPATAATVYKIGSMSQQLTAVLVLKQIERGKLALTDSIGRSTTPATRN